MPSPKPFQIHIPDSVLADLKDRLSRLDEKIQAPSAVALRREEVDHAPREWVERSYNLKHWTEFPKGSHLIALEQPELLAQDLRSFFRTLR